MAHCGRFEVRDELWALYDHIHKWFTLLLNPDIPPLQYHLLGIRGWLLALIVTSLSRMVFT